MPVTSPSRRNRARLCSSKAFWSRISFKATFRPSSRSSAMKTSPRPPRAWAWRLGLRYRQGVLARRSWPLAVVGNRSCSETGRTTVAWSSIATPTRSGFDPTASAPSRRAGTGRASSRRAVRRPVGPGRRVAPGRSSPIRGGSSRSASPCRGPRHGWRRPGSRPRSGRAGTRAVPARGCDRPPPPGPGLGGVRPSPIRPGPSLGSVEVRGFG